MNCSKLLMLLVLITFSGCEATKHEQIRLQIMPIENPDLSSDEVKLDPVPELSIIAPVSLSPDEKARIETLIKNLANNEGSGATLVPNSPGIVFLPLVYAYNSPTLLPSDQYTNKDLAAINELVKLGPIAVPMLLEALDDPTPTRISFNDKIVFECAIASNPVNREEQSIIQANPDSPQHLTKDADSDVYTVKIGDICFVILGQIVGRNYYLTRHDPIDDVDVVNSPVSNPEFCAKIRAIWTSSDSQQHLLSSLMVDYSTKGLFNGENLEGWNKGSDFQCEAAKRLLYYYPDLSAQLLADRLSGFDVEKCGVQEGLDHSEADRKAFFNREVKNGVYTHSFIKAVSWSVNPLITSALRDLKERTDDPDILKRIPDSP